MALITVVGIDPGADSGLVALAIDEHRPGAAERWYWIDGKKISKSSREHATKIENTLALYHKAHAFILAHKAVAVALERPADMEARKFIPGGQGQANRGQRAGTSFAIGEACGVLAAAASVARCRVYDYAATSRKANPSKNVSERRGWMPQVQTGNFTHTERREMMLSELHDRSVKLRNRPADGVLRADRGSRLDDNILMALGVLLYHLSRQHR